MDDDLAWNGMKLLAQEFVDTALLSAKIIISEICLPLEFKTIKPIGILSRSTDRRHWRSRGRTKGNTFDLTNSIQFQYQGILFKLALDTQLLEGPPAFWMYGGEDGPNDILAMKSAKNELKGLEAFLTTRTDGLFFPLMALIDYKGLKNFLSSLKGFRLTALSTLPISKETLRYGSHDSGVTVHTDLPELNEKMKSFAKKLNLKRNLLKFFTVSSHNWNVLRQQKGNLGSR